MREVGRDSTPVSLADGSVLAISATLPASRPTSWIAPGLPGYLAASCYVVSAGGHALIIDTGLGAHWEAIRTGLDATLAGAAATSLIMTRREPDAIGNLPAIVARYKPHAVFCGGVISPIDFFERVDAASTAHARRAIAQTDMQWVQPGTAVPVGPLDVEVLPTMLRVLPKNHLYESHSRTLFASDTWALLTQPSPGSVHIVKEEDDRLSTFAIANDLRHRFEWLAGIDTSPMQQEIAGLLARDAIQRICPTYGCIIEGPRLVATVLRNTIKALDILSCEERVQRMSGFRYDGVRALLEARGGDKRMLSD